MNIKTVKRQVKDISCLIVAYDVSKNKHDYYTQFDIGSDTTEVTGITSSQTDKVQEHFGEIQALADKHKFNFVKIVCEPTGGYEKVLMNQAREFGFYTECVNGEATHKAKVIESNDSGKNDKKDCRVIHMLATQGSTITCTNRPQKYKNLKLLNGKYEDLSLEGGRMKNRICSYRLELFPDLQLTPRQIYSKVGSCVISVYGLNPYTISQITWKAFEKKVTKLYGRKIGGSALTLLEKIYKDAKISALNINPEWYTDELESAFRDAYTRLLQIIELKEEYKIKMIDVLKQTNEYERLKDTPISDFMLSRLIAETGSWSDYDDISQLFRYGGMNLIEKQSGTYNGCLKLSKKGNSLMRKIMGQITFSTFIKKGALYADFYQKQKAKKGGFYGLACVMRKSLTMMFGLYKSNTEFNAERVFNQLAQPLAKTA